MNHFIHCRAVLALFAALVLDAFAKEGDAKSAERLLEQMVNSDDDSVMPNAHSYSAVLTAWSRTEDKAKAVRRADLLFDDIESRFASQKSEFRPDTSVYNALINCKLSFCCSIVHFHDHSYAKHFRLGKEWREESSISRTIHLIAHGRTRL